MPAGSKPSQGHWIPQFSSEFNIVFSNITSLLGSRRFIKNLEVWKIENPVAHAKFLHHYSSALQVDSWLNTKEFFAGTEKEILSSIHGGFAFPEGTKGMQFATGKLSGIEVLPAVNTASSSSKSKKSQTAATVSTVDEMQEHCFVMCVIAVGRASVVTSSENVEEMNIPNGYDSLYITTDNQKKTPSQHLYYINSSSRLRPTYYVKLKVSKDRRQSMYERLLSPATQPGAASNYQYFDFVSKRLLSSEEKAAMESGRGNQHHNHSHHHCQIVPLSEAVRQLVSSSQQQATEADSATIIAAASTVDKTAHVDALLDAVEEKTRQINSTYAHEFERIAELAKRAQADLQRRTRHKLNELRCAEVELERQLNYCKGLAQGLKSAAAAATSDPESIPSAIRFVHEWQAHEVLAAEASRYIGPEVMLVENMSVQFTMQGDFRYVDGGGGGAGGASSSSGNYSMVIGEMDEAGAKSGQHRARPMSALAEVLLLQQGGGGAGASDHNRDTSTARSVFSGDGVPSQRVSSRDKQAVVDNTMASIRKELAILGQQVASYGHSHGDSTSSASSSAFANFPIPPSIATAYGGSYSNVNVGVGGVGGAGAGFSSGSWTGSSYSSVNKNLNACELFDSSLRQMLASNESSNGSSNGERQSTSIVAGSAGAGGGGGVAGSKHDKNSRDRNAFTSSLSSAIPPPPPALSSSLGALSLGDESSSSLASLASTHTSFSSKQQQPLNNGNSSSSKMSSKSARSEVAGNTSTILSGGTAGLFRGEGAPLPSVSTYTPSASASAVFLSMEQLLLTSEPYRTAHSLKAAGDRKLRQMSAVTQKQLTGKIFAGSAILHPEECSVS